MICIIMPVLDEGNTLPGLPGYQNRFLFDSGSHGIPACGVGSSNHTATSAVTIGNIKP